MQDYVRELIQRRADEDPGYAIAAALLEIADNLCNLTGQLEEIEICLREARALQYPEKRDDPYPEERDDPP